MAGVVQLEGECLWIVFGLLLGLCTCAGHIYSEVNEPVSVHVSEVVLVLIWNGVGCYAALGITLGERSLAVSMVIC